MQQGVLSPQRPYGDPLFRRILVVCAANICRSPIVEGLLNARLRGTGARVSSAGLAAPLDCPADPIAQELLIRRGIDLSGHRSRRLTVDMVRSTEIVLVMDTTQRLSVEGLAPTARGKVYRLGTWSDFDVLDPFGKTDAAYRQTLAQIDKGLADWEARMWPRTAH